ncbi:MAG TPA: hypothetical protein VLF09_03005 [Cellvibrio sp.]|nr:hypothetical protein [Cellvibrio sp.]
MLDKEKTDAIIAAATSMQQSPNEENYINFINTVTPAVAIELANRHKKLARLILTISDDAWAITHQSLSQYRTALLKAAQEAS